MGDLPKPDAAQRLARAKSRRGREQLEFTAHELFAADRHALTDAQYAILHDILAALVLDLAADLRDALSSLIPAVPEIAGEPVAGTFDVLFASPALHDLELVEAVRHRALAHRLATHLRAERNGPGLLPDLCADPDPAIAQPAESFAADISSSLDPAGHRRLRITDLPPEVAEHLVLGVAAALRHVMIEHHADLDASQIDDGLEEVVQDHLPRLKATCGTMLRTPPVALALKAANRIAAGPLTAALNGGEVTLFESLMAAATGLRRKLVRRLFYEPGGECLAIMCTSLGFARDEFAHIFAAGNPVRASNGGDASDLELALGAFDRLEAEDVAGVMRRWRRDPLYLNGLRLLAEPGS